MKTTLTDVASKTSFLLIIYSALTGLVAIAFLIVQIVNWNATRKSSEEIAQQNVYLKKIQTEGVDRGLLQEQIKAEIEKQNKAIKLNN
jgi:ABC-type microcin C transport system permease subunit YejB